MSGWDDTSAPTGDDAWNGGNNTAGEDSGFNNFNADNTSKHETCRNCGKEGHFSRDCSELKQTTGECFNCGQVGHNKADCPNERVERPLTGTCRVCNQESHRAAECPEKPPTTCRACGQEGHHSSECTANRVVFGADVETMDAEKAYEMMVQADEEKDVDAFKKAFMSYAKALPEVTLADLEQGFRDNNFNTYLIAKEQEIFGTHTIVDLKGQTGRQYVVSFQHTDKPRRPKFAAGWPSSPEENMTRLQNAGFIMDSLKQKCNNCGEVGHGSRSCPQEKIERGDRATITCSNCKEPGHRVRDCPSPREDRNVCRNCKQPGHKASDCDQPRSAEGIECKNCGEMGHFSRDCPTREPMKCRNCGEEGHKSNECEKERVMTCRNCGQEGHISRECPEPRNTMTCRNCDQVGHMSKDCPEPKNWAKVQCRNCGEMGHGAGRCKNPPKEEEANTGFDDASAPTASKDWEDTAATGTDGGSGWGAATEPVAAGGW
ncbi:hypothetical protein H2203_004747 [Taxawa tesnikishii (nom. ined.)]|nr:hypothetical protein H2203_004747 [Dothideales sp. JES 119]